MARDEPTAATGRDNDAAVAACRHEWRWLPQPVFIQSRDGEIVDCHNVECATCHERTWAFGIMPNARPILETTTPTTERT